MERWFAVCCKPRQELVAQRPPAPGFPCIPAAYPAQASARGQWIDVIGVLFSALYFIRIDPARAVLPRAFDAVALSGFSPLWRTASSGLQMK